MRQKLDARGRGRDRGTVGSRGDRSAGGRSPDAPRRVPSGATPASTRRPRRAGPWFRWPGRSHRSRVDPRARRETRPAPAAGRSATRRAGPRSPRAAVKPLSVSEVVHQGRVIVERLDWNARPDFDDRLEVPVTVCLLETRLTASERNCSSGPAADEVTGEDLQQSASRSCSRCSAFFGSGTR